MRRFIATVVLGSVTGPGVVAEQCVVGAEDVPRYAALAVTHGYGSPFMARGGEFVVAASVVVYVDGQVPDVEAEAAGQAEAGLAEAGYRVARPASALWPEGADRAPEQAVRDSERARVLARLRPLAEPHQHGDLGGYAVPLEYLVIACKPGGGQ